MKKQLHCFALVFFTITLLTQCSPTRSGGSEKLQSITLIDNNQFSETITNTDRLAQYENVDFRSNQPYEKILQVFGRDNDGNMHSVLTSYHPNGQLKQYLEVTNNQALGLYQEWFSSGQKHIEAHVVGGTADLTSTAEKTWLFNGESHVWNDEGKLIATIGYSKGVQEGLSIHYHSDGTLWKRIPFSKGKINGSYEIYLEGGLCLQTVQFINGKKHGASVRYWPNKQIASEEMFTQGLLSHGRYYDKSGTTVAKVDNGNGSKAVFSETQVAELHEIKKGLQEGKVEIFSEKGLLLHSYHTQNNQKHGEEVIYKSNETSFERPEQHLSINWFQGKIQGITKSWYDDGTLESQREMSNNKKNGLLTAWYQDGSLMLVEEYENDILVKGEYYKRGEKNPYTQVWDGNGIASMFDSKGNFVEKVTYHNGKPQG